MPRSGAALGQAASLCLEPLALKRRNQLLKFTGVQRGGRSQQSRKMNTNCAICRYNVPRHRIAPCPARHGWPRSQARLKSQLRIRFTQRPVKSNQINLKYFIPEYNNYYHLVTESVMGLYRLLRDNDQLEQKGCEIWYKGRYTQILQLFSKQPVHVVEHSDQVPSTVRVLEHIRPAIHEDWLKLRPLAAYLQAMFPKGETLLGITVIKRINKRIYSDHDQLVCRLKEFGKPVREVVMEGLSLRGQIEVMRNTCILVGPHGSGETNMMFMPDGSKILELYPMGFRDRVFAELARAFGHELVELESEVPSVIGRKPTQKFSAYLKTKGWPARKHFTNHLPSIEFRRVLRDVASFSIDPSIVIERLRTMIERQ